MSDEINEVVRARNEYSGLFTYGRKPTPEVEAAARQKLATAKIDRAIHEALAASPALHPAQVEYLTGLLHSTGGA